MKNTIKDFLECCLAGLVMLLYIAVCVVGLMILVSGFKPLNIIRIIIGIVILSFCIGVMLFADTYHF